MLRAFIILIIVAAFVMTALQSYWNHQVGVERNERIEGLMRYPNARPDAWTRTMDNSRTERMCEAIKLLSVGSANEGNVIILLPEVCK